MDADVERHFLYIARSLTDKKGEHDLGRGSDEERLAVTHQVSLTAPNSKDMLAYLLLHKYYRDVQEDAHEFLTSLLQTERSPNITQLFQGLDEPMYCCASCGTQRRVGSSEAFACLCVPLTHEATRVSSVQQALNNYFEPESMDVNFRWACDNCQSRLPPRKRAEVTVPPQVLLLQLKRWIFNPDASTTLLNHEVQVEEMIQIKSWMYRLCATVYHLGDSPKSGHYFTIARHDRPEGSWWLYNDNLRRLVRPEDSTPPRKAYLCVYERVPTA